MLIIVDKSIPGSCKQRLAEVADENHGSLIEFQTRSLVYPAISGHPDIFFCKTPQTLIISPDLPHEYRSLLSAWQVPFTQGNFPVSQDESASDILYQFPSLTKQKIRKTKFITSYNAAVNEGYLVHRLEFTDPVILENCHYLKKISVMQGYTRCNLLLVKEDHYVTSDHGIHESLKRSGLNGLYVDPSGILLPGFPNGFIGGTMGCFNETVYILGNLRCFSEGETLRQFFHYQDLRVEELYDGPLYDGGGILFV